MLDRSAQPHHRGSLVVAVAVVAIATSSVLVTNRVCDAWTATSVEHEERVLDVAGMAERHRIEPDRVDWKVTLEATARTRSTVERDLAARRDAILAKLVELGIADVDIRVQPVSIDEPTRTAMTGYGALYADVEPRTEHIGSQEIAIHSREIAPSMRAFEALTREQLSQIRVEPPHCWLSDDAMLLRDLQNQAWSDARFEAEHIVRTLDARLGALVSVQLDTLEVVDTEEPWACEQGLDAVARVQVTYQLR